MKLRIGHLSTLYHTALILMADGAAARKIGTDIEWRLFGTGPAIVDAFEKGELDLAYVGLPPAIIGISRGVRIVCVAGGHMEGTVIAGGKELVGFPEEQDLTAILCQLRGKRIGVPGKGSIHEVILAECLENSNCADEIEVVRVPWADQITEALIKGALSAGVGTPALAASIKRFARGKILYPPSRLWPNNPSYGILVCKEFLENARGTVEKFLVLHEDATSFIRKKPRQAAGLVSDYIGFIDEDFVLDTLRVSPKYCAHLTGEYIASTMKFVSVLKRRGYIKREVDRGDIFDTSLIQEIHPEKDHYGEGIADSLL